MWNDIIYEKMINWFNQTFVESVYCNFFIIVFSRRIVDGEEEFTGILTIFHSNENYPILLIPSFSSFAKLLFLRKGKIFAKNGREIDKHLTIKEKEKEERKGQTRGKTWGRNIRIFTRTPYPPNSFSLPRMLKALSQCSRKKRKPETKRKLTEATSPYPNTIYKSSPSLILVVL